MSDFWKYLLLGIVQGISEVLPISSSAHLILVQNIMGIKSDDLSLEVFLHMASLVAIVFFLRKRLCKLVWGSIKYILYKKEEDYKEFKMMICLIVSTLPVVIFTLLFKSQIDVISGNIFSIGLLLLINGALLLYFMNFNDENRKRALSYKDALVVGVFECMGVFPGISRSGSCLCGGKLRKLSREEMADYAFLLFIPAAVGAMVLEFDNLSQVIFGNDLWMYLVVFVVTSVVTYLSLNILLSFIKRGKIKYFGYYCMVMGLIIVLFEIIK
ncbi:MAG: undecaprenyl-diphosphate phosphatase [Bacilli bacterium]|nr:undecaprenyl-diphosphate phosphatase [Bacilli bacterium]